MSVMTQPSPTQVELRLCGLEEIPPGLGRAFEVRGTEIAVFRSRAGAVHAVENRCPHRGAPLSEGMLAGNQVVCPFHAFRYDLQTGACDQAGACSIETFPARVQDGWVLLTISKSSK